MDAEHRTQIYLSEAEYQRTMRYARQHSASLAKVVREALAEYLAAHEGAAKTVPLGRDPLDGLAGIWKDEAGPRDLSARHDAYLAEALEAKPARRARRARR